MHMEKVCVIGLGYIGLPTASLLATKGFQVTGVDISPKVVDTINKGGIHIYEPDLDILVKAAVQSGNLKAALKPAPADIFIMAVPTPFREGHKPNVTYVEAATRALAPVIKPGNLVILESTSPVGTTEKIGQWLKEERPELEFATRNKNSSDKAVHLAHCPERVLPGHILRELVNNDRIIGGLDQVSAEKAQNFYSKFVSGEIFLTDARTAEMCKLTENSYRDVNIAFANELSVICEKLDISVWELIEMANKHPRVKILQPGPGVGGHCIAVDPWFIVDSAPEESRLIRTARVVNDSKPHFVIEKVKEKASHFKQPKIACLGLSFKADIDDLRESPAVEIVKELASSGCQLLVSEPHIKKLPEELEKFSNIRFAEFDEATREADILVLLVNHRQFSRVSTNLLREKVVIDTRGAWR
jgi:UDP-N-acetyl-D-mannosaminuronic acid dehydrogenase